MVSFKQFGPLLPSRHKILPPRDERIRYAHHEKHDDKTQSAEEGISSETVRVVCFSDMF